MHGHPARTVNAACALHVSADEENFFGALQGAQGCLLWVFIALGALQEAQKVYVAKVYVPFAPPNVCW